MSGAGVRTPQRVARRLVAVLVLALAAGTTAAAPSGAAATGLAGTGALTVGAVSSEADTTPVMVVGVRLSLPAARPGVLGAISYTVDADDVDTVSMTVQVGSTGEPAWVPVYATGPRSGEWQFSVPSLSSSYRMVSITTRDKAGNEATFDRSGTWTSTTGSTGTHTLDLPSLDVVATGLSPVKVSGVAHPRSADLTLEAPTWEEGADTLGYSVTVSPGGRVVDVRASGTSMTKAVIGGLVPGTTYSLAVVARSIKGPTTPTTIKVRPMLSRQVFSAGDVDRDGRMDLFATVPGGAMTVFRGNGRGSFSRWRTGWQPPARLHPNARVGRDASYLSSVDDAGRLCAAHVGRTGWDGGCTPVAGRRPGRFLDGLADLSGDGRADLVVLTEAGTLNLYRGAGGTAQYASGASVLARGWVGMRALMTSPDLTGDRRADLLAVDAAGVLWIYPGTGRSTLGARRKVGGGWLATGGVFAARDVTGDGRADLGAVTMDGRLLVYPGRGNGSFGRPVVAATGMQKYL